uniref:Uncharacterized protein n=1 Tax=Anguilla anguilla TaxID=7936 RepID=A0A0E9VQX8_ANGAN
MLSCSKRCALQCMKRLTLFTDGTGHIIKWE